jgi:hypothetical protein
MNELSPAIGGAKSCANQQKLTIKQHDILYRLACRRIQLALACLSSEES